MKLKNLIRLKATLTLSLLIIASYSVISMASIGRFTTTHAIVMQSRCTDCHTGSLIDLNSSMHIGAMGFGQATVIDNYVLMTGSSDLNGLCMSCHNVRKTDFVFYDPFIYHKSGNMSGNISAINGITFFDPDRQNYLTNDQENETVRVRIEVRNVYPEEASVAIDATIQLANFSGHQDHNKTSTNVMQSLSGGEILNITRTDIFADYFSVYLNLGGIWEYSELNLTVEGYPAVTINSSNGSSFNYYSLPADVPVQYSNRDLFHTRDNYTVKRMDGVINDMRNASVLSISLDEIMDDRIGNSSGYSCNSPDALCHINQRITEMGQTNGVRDGRYYSHELAYSTYVCRNCHI